MSETLDGVHPSQFGYSTLIATFGTDGLLETFLSPQPVSVPEISPDTPDYCIGCHQIRYHGNMAWVAEVFYLCDRCRPPGLESQHPPIVMYLKGTDTP
jgi:hypothetical protein